MRAYEIADEKLTKAAEKLENIYRSGTRAEAQAEYDAALEEYTTAVIAEENAPEVLEEAYVNVNQMSMF